jgi:hypothetical protein
MKMEETECSETLAFKLQTPGNNPEESIRRAIHLFICLHFEYRTVVFLLLVKYFTAEQSWHSQLALYARNIPSAVCAAAPEDEKVMLVTCRGH